MSMTRRYLPALGALLALLGAVASAPAQADAASAANFSYSHAHGYHTHTLGIFIGAASDNLGHRDEGLALGMEYEYRLNKPFGVGAIVEHTYGNLDTWVYALPLSYHRGRWKIYAAPGIEDGHHGSESMLRVGFEYGYRVGAWDIAPQVDVDLIERERDVFVVGLTILRGFDF
jgi:hypothetical protein